MTNGMIARSDAGYIGWAQAQGRDGRVSLELPGIMEGVPACGKKFGTKMIFGVPSDPNRPMAL